MTEPPADDAEGSLPDELPAGDASPADLPAATFPDPPYRRLQLSLLTAVIVGLLATFLGFWPVRQLILPRFEREVKSSHRPTRILYRPEPATAVRIGLVEGITCLWFFALGASVGSFLNVVLYRVPLGKSIVSGGSGCPHCGHFIRATDNVPVVGWWRLGGACRDCRWPIPFRYPLMELLFGSVYLGLTLLELHAGAPNLPGHFEPGRGLAETIWSLEPHGLATFGYHLALWHWLLLTLLFAFDGHRLPGSVFWFGLLIGFLTPLMVPGVVPVDWLGDTLRAGVRRDGLTAWITSLAGFAGGALLAGPWLLQPGSAATKRGIGEMLWLASVYLGWQLGLLAAVLAALAQLLTSVGRPNRSELRGLYATLGIILLLFLGWRWVTLWPIYPQRPYDTSTALLLAAYLVSSVIRYLAFTSNPLGSKTS